jgi:hypothetical protein
MPPSGSPVKEAIIDNLQTTLEAILGGAAYYTTVALVSRINTVPIEVKDYPAIIITPLGTDYDQPGDATTLALHGSFKARLTLIVRTRDNASEALENFIRDVHKAILVDITRGGIAINSRMLSDEVYYPTQIEEPVAVADCVVLVSYRTLRTDLNQAT